MAPDKKDKKRKAVAAVAAADSPAKKTKKAAPKPTESPKGAPKPILKKTKEHKTVLGENSAAKPKVNSEPARQNKPRKRAADFLSDNDDSEAEADVTEPKVDTEKSSSKKSKKADGSAAPVPKAKASNSDDTANTKAKKPAGDSDESAANGSTGEEDEEDDQTVALIKGFESSGDEDESGDEGFDPDQPVPKIPDSKKVKRKLLKKQKEGKAESEEPGTVYIGRIPHGFYEHQMRAYFSQFGEITRLRLSRNRITGRSKHYAFVEFASTSVAKIVAGTMDNYLMYGHILKCKFVPQDQLHPEVWKGANRRFKRTPWNLIEKKRLNKGKTREQWTDRIEREQKRRLAKAEKLKALGYEIDLPRLKSVDEVPIQEETKTIECSEAAAANETLEGTPKAVDAPIEEQVTKNAKDTPKREKKENKGTPKQTTPKKGVKEVAASPATKAGAKAKKSGKGKK